MWKSFPDTRWRWWRSSFSAAPTDRIYIRQDPASDRPTVAGQLDDEAVLTGRHDLILTVLLNEEFGLLDFYTNEFSKCHDRVSSIETFIVYKGFSLKVPYIL